MWYAVAVFFAMLLLGLAIWKRAHKNSLDEARLVAQRRGQYTDEQIEETLALKKFPVPGFVTGILLVAIALPLGAGLFQGAFFYAEPGFRYHVRTITGTEKVVDDVGYNMHLFGRVDPWKKALSVVAEAGNSSEEAVSAVLPPMGATFLDQVDAEISATARYRLPSDPDQFLKMAREYRSQENLLRTTLIPAFKETIRANAALMGAEDYFSGAQTQFNIDFENQLEEGLFIVRRKEVVVSNAGTTNGSANASLGTEQDEYGDDTRVVFEVDKITDSQGVARRKIQSFQKLGITVVEARITNVFPNSAFMQRMSLKQKASADRAIAVEQRVQEEEQKLLAITIGEREVAQQQAAALVEQIKITTDAETQKQLAITNAEREIATAEIQRDQAAILLEKARIDADAKTVQADAEAYAKAALIEADNALQQKLDTLVEINGVWADAYSKRAVPTTVFGGGSDGMSSDSGAQTFMDIMTMKAAKDLDVDMTIARPASQ